MRLSEFILANVDRIMQRWEDFARSLPSGRALTVSALRDDAEHMLRFIARDIETPQSQHEQYEKSIGAGRQASGDEPGAGHDHGLARAVDRFSLSELVSEYRALRASVLSLWFKNTEAANDMEQTIRFDEAVDQLIAESVQRYSAKLESDADTFTASIGHDLRNPLNAISMCSELLNISASVSAADRKVVEQIAQSAVRLSSMLGELQDFSRTRLGGMLDLKRKRVDIAGLCDKVIAEVRASTPDCEITFSQAGDTVASVSGERIQQLLSNLVVNAVQHGEQGCDVDVTLLGQDNVVVIRVTNTGPPIPPEALHRIFEPLYRDDSKDEKRMHLGLGLYIARTIALAHGGAIDVTSTQDAGTTFEVSLPRDA